MPDPIASVPIETLVAFEEPHQSERRPTDLVSITVSLFNYGRFLEECLASVAAQTHPDLELIIVDDCSTDGSEKVAATWLAQHKRRFARALLVRHLQNQGLSQARNTGFLLANADFVFALDADNVIYPRAIARLYEALAGTDFGVAYSQLETFDEAPGLGYADIWDPAHLARGNYIDAMALIAKWAWQKVGGYTLMKFGWEDYDLWCKFVEHGIAGVFVPEILCRYRIRSASMLRQITNPRVVDLIQDMTARHPWLALKPP